MLSECRSLFVESANAFWRHSGFLGRHLSDVSELYGGFVKFTYDFVENVKEVCKWGDQDQE